MPSIHSFTAALTAAQADKLRDRLPEWGFDFVEKPYTLYAAQKGKLNVAVYVKGPKVLVQGKETEEFVTFPPGTGDPRGRQAGLRGGA